MLTYLGTTILFGDMPDEELPKLPDGWCYKKAEKCWLLARSPKGEFYYVASDRLYPQRTRKETGTFFVDTENGVIHLEQHDTTKE
jgi:hypothetical protein